jgi:hypothetical protein
LITRVATETNTEVYARKWHPQVETSMLHMFLPNKARLVNYVLHAKHSRVEAKADRLDNIIMSGGGINNDPVEETGDLGSPSKRGLARTTSVPDFSQLVKQAEKVFFGC